LTAIAYGCPPVATVGIAFAVSVPSAATSYSDTVPLFSLTTYALVPSAVTATLIGTLPVPMLPDFTAVSAPPAVSCAATLAP
jgi:hypothetical protein